MRKQTNYLAWIAALGLSAVAAQSAQAKFVAIFEETERGGLPSVQEIGDGTIDLNDLGAGSSANGVRSSISPQTATTVLGGTTARSKLTLFDNAVISGPSNFGAGPGAFADRVRGNAVVESTTFIGVPQGYVSGDPLRNATSWINATYSSLGMTPGIYTWSWGSGADADSFRIEIVPPSQGVNNSVLSDLPLPTTEEFPLTFAAPEPSTWAMMLIGFAGLGYAAFRRRGSRLAHRSA